MKKQTLFNLKSSKPFESPDGVPWLVERERFRWLVSSNYGKTVSINFDDLLPDGTRLSNPVNSEFADTVLCATFEARGGADPVLDTGEGQASTAKMLILFVSWLVLRGINRLESVTKADIRDYLKESQHGYEYCFRTEERMEAALEDLCAEGFPLASISLKSAFEHAGIPFFQRSKCPLANAIFYRVTENIEIPLEPSLAHQDDTENPLEEKLSGAVTKRLSQSSLHQKSFAISLLWRYRSSLPFSLQFDPFPDGIKRSINKLGRPNGNTKTMPIEVAYHLAESAALWVTTIGPALIKLKANLGKVESDKNNGQVKSEKQRLFQQFNVEFKDKLRGVKLVPKKQFKNSSDITLRSALYCYVPTACFIVSAILTGRRNEEISGLEIDAIVGDTESGWWLTSIIEKTLKKKDFTPCSPLVVEAVQLMKKIGETVRGKEGTSKLFVTPRSDGAKTSHSEFRIELHLNTFARLVETPIVKDGESEYSWHFTPHQFRRIFAILFVWRYEFGHLGALSYQLRHFNLKMTQVYVRDAELNKLLGEEYHRLTLTKLRALANKGAKGAGLLGKAFQRTIERFRSQIEIADESDIERKIIRLVDQRKLTLRATIWGFCGASASPSNLRRASCQALDNQSRRLDESGAPDASGSDESLCAKCLFHLTDESRKAHWAATEATLSAAVKHTETSDLLRKALSARLSVIRSFLLNSFAR